jgi:transposase
MHGKFHEAPRTCWLKALSQPEIFLERLRTRNAYQTLQWTTEDIFYLESKIHIMSMDDLCARLNRTEASIIQKAQQLGINKISEGYSLNALVAGFGVHHKTIERWIDKGWLKGKRRQTERERDIWYFSDTNVRDFVKRHPEEVNPTKTDWIWLVDVLCGGIGELGSNRIKSKE